MFDYKIGFIGTGNIASAIFGGITSSGYIKPKSVYVFDTDPAKTNAFCKGGAVALSSAEEVTALCDFVFLTVKPQIYPTVLSFIKPFAANTCFVSVAAGITIDFVKDALGFNAPVVRVMPNTPMLYGYGSSGIVRSEPVTDEQFDFVKGCFDSCGVTSVVDESLINVVTAVSGSAPAYIMLFAKCFIDYAVRCGINSEDAKKLVLQVFKGSAEMIEADSRTPEELIKMVTSPNGTTQAGLTSLEAAAFEKVVSNCLDATVRRADELTK